MTAESGTAGAGAGATRTLGGATGAAARARAGRADDVDARDGRAHGPSHGHALLTPQRTRSGAPRYRPRAADPRPGIGDDRSPLIVADYIYADLCARCVA